MSCLGSLSECLLLAKDPLKLLGKFQDRDDCPSMTGGEWISDWQLKPRSSQSVLDQVG